MSCGENFSRALPAIGCARIPKVERPSMTPVILFIRRPGEVDIADIHDSENAARDALISFVREHWNRADIACPVDDNEAIKAFREGQGVICALVTARRPS